MLAIAAKRVRDSLQAVFAQRQPAALAWSVSLGILIGGMPPATWIPVCGVVAALFIRNNIGLTAGMAALSSVSVEHLEVRVEQLGRILLEANALQSAWQTLAAWPLLPWLAWNNSLVLGTVAMAFAAYMPVWCLMKAAHRQRLPQLILNRWDTSRNDPMTASHTSIDRCSRPVDVTESTDVDTMSATLDLFLKEQDQISQQYTSSSDRQRSIRSRGANRHRIDDHVTDVPVSPRSVDARIRDETSDKFAMTHVPDDAVLQETVIEIVRYRSSETDARDLGSLSADDTSLDFNPITLTSSVNTTPQMQSKPFSTTPPLDDATARPKVMIHRDPTVSSLAMESNTDERPREEALRYLLWHLSGVKRSEPMMSERGS